MAKKTLDGKISSAIFWLLMFFISYFIIGFVLKVDLSSQFNANAFYDVLNDSLTLLAYFLAPVAALVLFSDWREQHKAVSLEKNTQETYKYLNDSFKAILEFKYEVCKGVKLDEDRCLGIVSTKDKVLHLIDFAERSLNLINDKDDISQFKTECKEIAGLLKSCLTKLYELDIGYQKSNTTYCPNFLFADGQINEISTKLTSLSKKLENFKV